jgi:putative transposase
MRLSSTAVRERQLLHEGLGELGRAAEERIFNFDARSWLKGMLEDCMLTEFEERQIGVQEYERSDSRKNQRNGFYTRSLTTVYGLIEDLKVPRPRIGGFTPHAFEKYERREKRLNQMIEECYWRGISTRDMTHIMKQLTGCHISASVVTRLTEKWTDEALRWHDRPLADDYVYLAFDGVWIKNRSIGGKRRLVLVAYGVRTDGSREIIDYELSFSEGESNWLKFLTHLSARGLEGKKLKLIVSDGCKGLANAIDIVFPKAKHQLCWAHKMRNILNKVKAADQDEVKKDLRKMFRESTQTKAQAQSIVWHFRKKWRTRAPSAVRCLERDLEKLLHYLDCPIEHHKAIRTSNHIERQFKEFRRRLRPMEMLPSKDSAERALYALTQIRNEKLKEYPLVPFTHKNLH